MITVGDALILGALLALGHKAGATLEEIKAAIPLALKMEGDVAALQLKPQLYETLTIDLSTARDKEKQDVSGDFLYAQSIDGELDVRFNEQESQALTLDVLNRTYQIRFDCLYLSNTAQSGKSATLLIGKGGAFTAEGTKSISVNAQNVGVYIGAEWESKQGNLRCMGCGGDGMLSEEKDVVEYMVPSGKAFYIYNINGSSTAHSASTDGDANQIMMIQLRINGQVVSIIGGNGGCATAFSTPFKVSAFSDVTLEVWNYANHVCNTYAWLSGFEVDI